MLHTVLVYFTLYELLTWYSICIDKVLFFINWIATTSFACICSHQAHNYNLIDTYDKVEDKLDMDDILDALDLLDTLEIFDTLDVI